MVKKHFDTFARYAGLVTVCFEWLAVILFYLLRPSDFNGEHPISYFASLPETRVVFSICLFIAAVSFWIFTRYHLNKHYNVPVALFTFSMLGYAAMALTPFNPNDPASDIIHKILALSFSLTFLAGIYFIGKNNHDSQVRLMSYLALVLSSLAMIGFFIIPKGSSHMLLLEAASAFICQVWVVWISFHSFKTSPRLS